MLILTVLLFPTVPLVLAELHGPVDLSHSYGNSSLCWPGSTLFHFTLIETKHSGDNWYAANEFETAEHCGTHLDAPYHFNNIGWKVADIPLERLFGKVVLVDLRSKAKEDPDYLVTGDDFEDWERHHGLIPEGSVVLLDFGWAARYNNQSQYFGTEDINDTSSFHFPGLSEQGAKWLIETGKVFGVGTDTASIDYGQSKEFSAHRTLAANNIYILEHVSLPMTPLPPTGYQIVALPMKIQQGTGGPCRIVALPSVHTNTK